MALTRPRIAQINTNITALTDAITVLNAGATSANVDSGFLINRAHGLISNAAIYYSETLDTFVTAFTSNSGGTDSNIVISSYVDFTTGNVFSTGLHVTGNTTITGNLSIANTGDISANIGSYQTWANTALIATNNAIITANTGMKSYVDDQIIIASGYGNTQVGAYLLTNTGNIAAGNIEVSGNIVGGSVRTTTSATAPANPTPGDMWYDTSADILFRYTDIGTGRYWLDINGQTLSFDLTGNVVAGNVVARGYYWSNGAPFVSSTYGEANVVAYLGPYFTYANANAATQSTDIATLQTQVYDDSNVASYLTGNITVGNIVPTGNNVVNLGSPTARFGSLYLAGNTIDLGGTLITTSANGAISVSGNLTIAGEITSTVPLYGNANVAVYLPTHTGNVSANTVIVDNGIFWANGNSYSSGSGGVTQARAWATTMLFGG